MVNIFPLRHYVFEGHLYLPFVHRIASSDLMRGYIALLSRLGLGKYKGHRSAFGVSVDRYSERHADYMQFYTNYLSESEVYDVVKRVGMRAAFRYSKERYTGKLRAILKMPPKLLYFTGDRGLSDSIAVKVLRYVSGVTFVCENSESYRN